MMTGWNDGVVVTHKLNGVISGVLLGVFLTAVASPSDEKLDGLTLARRNRAIIGPPLD